RGNNNHLYPENSLEAILSSLDKEYIKGVEFDVRLTKDNKLVIIHDFTINRTSNGHGIVKNMTLKELKKYKFGNKNYTYTIMTLDQLLRKVKSSKIIIIEIKHELGNIKEVVDKLIRVIKKHRNLDIYITGFSYKLTDYIKDNYPQFKVGSAPLIVTKNTNFNDGYDAYFIKYNFFGQYKTNKLLFFWTINKLSFFNNKISQIKNNMFFITDKAYLLKDI
ncbi:MAG: glycerophosphodiester phosphodiesterase family protein, partial [Bacilli bacterium]|nr:glycerophosphodiester phosphodiesterase family protein [Bacilli bacterium]MDD4718947.1 glycerophosphodiester phosphodiesterase family protein [Bacilli bacterium]